MQRRSWHCRCLLACNSKAANAFRMLHLFHLRLLLTRHGLLCNSRSPFNPAKSHKSHTFGAAAALVPNMLRPSLATPCLLLALLSLGARAGTLTSVSLSWSRPQPEANPLAISFVLRATWLAGSVSGSLAPGNSFSDGFFCPIDGQIPKCVAAQLLVVSKLSDQVFTELRTTYT